VVRLAYKVAREEGRNELLDKNTQLEQDNKALRTKLLARAPIEMGGRSITGAPNGERIFDPRKDPQQQLAESFAAAMK
jgi:hypothetical protein